MEKVEEIRAEKPIMVEIPKDIPKQIRNCFHSYDICEDLSSKSSLEDDEQDSLKRNKEHIQIMYAWDWFKDALSNEESEKLKKYI
jgi:hypothetical protein